MTIGTLENTEDAIGQSIALTRQARSDLESQIRTLDGRLAGLGTQWQGRGASAFVAVHQTWNEQVKRLMAALDGFDTALQGIERSFEATDAEATSAFTQLSSRLG